MCSIPVKVLSLAGATLVDLTASLDLTTRDLMKMILTMMNSQALIAQLRLLVGDTELKDEETLLAACGKVDELTLTLLMQNSLSGNFADFNQNWQVVATAENDPHSSYLYNPRNQLVSVHEDGSVTLSCRGRIATRREVIHAPLQGVIVISGKFMCTGSNEDFLTVCCGLRPVHTGQKPYGEMDDGEFCINIDFWGGVHCSLGSGLHGSRKKLADFVSTINETYSFAIRLDAESGNVSVTLEGQDFKTTGRLEADLTALTLPGHHVAIFNREFSRCTMKLWDVEVSVP